MRAYVDESFRDGCYVVAAALVADARVADLEQELRHLFRNRRRPFHWQAEERRDRIRMLAFITEYDIDVLTIGVGLPDVRKQERARAHCLQRLLWELRSASARELIIESRQKRNNQRDLRTIQVAQTSGWAAADLGYRFGIPALEPLLWIPDAIAALTSAARCGIDQDLHAIVGHRLRAVWHEAA